MKKGKNCDNAQNCFFDRKTEFSGRDKNLSTD